MTAIEATTFQTYSIANAAKVKGALSCGCAPYVDVFTYRRWLALGFQVQRGQKAIKIPVVKVIQSKETFDGDGNPDARKVLGSGAVFCRCQVKPIEV